jgi:hypothetical protein
LNQYELTLWVTESAVPVEVPPLQTLAMRAYTPVPDVL